MITKFKVGDIVIGNEKACRYGITKTGWIGKVVSLYGNGYIGVNEIDNSSKICYAVIQEAFDLFGTPNTVSEQTEKEFEEMLFDSVN